MQFSDLHIHSRFSDGILWPKEIIHIAHQKKIKYLSITDHDTIESQCGLQDYAKTFDLFAIPGVELSTEYKEREVHILGYFIDIYNNELTSVLTGIKESRRERAKEIIEKLSRIGIILSFDDIICEDISIGRPHIAKALVAKGYANNTKEAFQQFLIKGKPGYVDRFKIHYKDALRLISNCNGLSVLAHPGEIHKGISTEEIIREFKVYGLKGMEVFHPSHSSKQVNDYYNLSKKYSLAITGGSDCHGTGYNNENLIGSCGINEPLTQKLLKYKYK